MTLSKQEILRALSRADQLARNERHLLSEQYPKWVKNFAFLSQTNCPKTYLPVVAILLTARSLRASSELDVLAIQQQTSSKGYSASSIGSLLIPFATEQGIDLRSKSSQVMNNQPFCYKKRIEPGMSERKAVQYANFYAIANTINDLTQQDAHQILALLFQCNRTEVREPITFTSAKMGWCEARAKFNSWESFVRDNSDNGKVGLIFATSMLDIVYGSDSVTMGRNWDPDVTTPGDIQTHIDGQPWLWVEVKQKPITTGDVQAFCGKVLKAGGTRILYCALANENYRANLDHRRLQSDAIRKSIELVIVESPTDLVNILLSRSPGIPGDLVAKMASALMVRMIEADLDPALCERLEELSSQLLD